jgi:hypothetical protein
VPSGLTQPFTLTVSSPAGYSNLTEVNAPFNTTLSGVNACYIRCNRTYNLLYLADNAGSYDWMGGFAPGSAGSASNSQCTINGIGASFSAAGTLLSVTIPVTFQAAFSGLKSEYLAAHDQYGLHSGWQTMGTWTVPGGDAVTCRSLKDRRQLRQHFIHDLPGNAFQFLAAARAEIERAGLIATDHPPGLDPGTRQGYGEAGCPCETSAAGDWENHGRLGHVVERLRRNDQDRTATLLPMPFRGIESN